MVPDGLRIYELFDGDNSFYSIHTLEMLGADKEYFEKYLSNRVGNIDEALKDIKEIKKYVSEYSLNPYLALNGLDSGFKESETYTRLTGLVANLWSKDPKLKDGKIEVIGGEDKKLNYLVQRVPDPGSDMKFLKNMLNIVTSDRSPSRFHLPVQAEELFMEYANEEALPLMMEKLKLISGLYNRFGKPGDSIDD